MTQSAPILMLISPKNNFTAIRLVLDQTLGAMAQPGGLVNTSPLGPKVTHSVAGPRREPVWEPHDLPTPADITGLAPPQGSPTTAGFVPYQHFIGSIGVCGPLRSVALCTIPLPDVPPPGPGCSAGAQRAVSVPGPSRAAPPGHTHNWLLSGTVWG